MNKIALYAVFVNFQKTDQVQQERLLCLSLNDEI